MANRKIGRDASTGQFTSVRDAKRRPSSTTVETMPGTVRHPRPRRRTVRSIAEQNGSERSDSKPDSDL